MKSTKLQNRYLRIMLFFAGTTLEFIFWELFLAKIGLRSIVRKNRSTRYQQTARRFRSLALHLGGVMIKMGQFLSSRLDVLPPEITWELASLQDEVPSEKYDAIREIAEEELGAKLSDRFEFFEEIPMAAASLGQVHRARLRVADAKDGFCEVVVKIQRPFIEQLIEVDLSALRRFGGWLQKYKPVAKRVNVPGLIEEFSTITRAEIDYIAEGKNAETFSANFTNNPRVHVPRVVWDHTTRKVLTLEDVFAIKITDYEAITAAGIDRGEVANELLDIYLKQIFEDGFFHADPHPGNLFITPYEGKDGINNWKLTFVDFGMVGLVPDNLIDGLRELVVGVGTRDAGRLVKAYKTLNILLPSADLKMIEQAEAELFELFWGKSMSELTKIHHAEMFRFAEKFRELMFEMPFQVPQNLLMLVRAVAILSGMCTGLNKDFNLWGQLAPYAKKLISKEANTNWQAWLDEIGNVLKELVALPSQFGRVISRLEKGDLEVKTPMLNQQVALLERSINRLGGSILFAAFFIGGIIFLQGGKELTAYILFAGSGLVLLWILINGRGKPRRFQP